MKEITYPEILKTNQEELNILLGNGFSIAYDANTFSYPKIKEYVRDSDGEILKNIIDEKPASNIEELMKILDDFRSIAKFFPIDENTCNIIKETADKLSNGLVEAVQKLHPDHMYTMTDNNSKSCTNFLSDYLNIGKVFTVNYDLLLYWVLLRSKDNGGENFIDGFGKENGKLVWGKYKDRQNIFYLHGALHIFDEGVKVIKASTKNNNLILDVIKNNFKSGKMPIFVAAGDANTKLASIMHNQYLMYCYEQLQQITGSIVTLGFSFNEIDTHIIQAILNNSNLENLYIGIFTLTDIDRIEKMINKFHHNCNVYYYDTKTIDVWGKNNNS